jgi:hypothetical protein
MYHEWAYGPARLTWPELEVPHDPAAALAMLEEGHCLLRGDLERLTEPDLDDLRLTNWGERWPAWRIFWSMSDHDALHGGAIGQLRDLYRWRGG